MISTSCIVAVLIAASAYGAPIDDDFLPLHTIYATPGNQGGFARHKLNYIATMCGGEAFDGQKATITLNLPTHAWDVSKGYWLRVHATNSEAKALGDNNATSGEPKFLTQSFSFIYHAAGGDIYFEVQLGSGSGYHTFTFAMSFEKTTPPSLFPRRHVVSRQENEMRAARDDYLRYYEPNAAKNIVHTQLLQIFKIQGTGDVKTTEFRKYRMDYCFQPASTQAYNITVTVVALNGKSAFGLYVCPASVQPCTINSAPPEFTDISGTAACFVHVPIYQKDYGTMRAIVQGDGRFAEENTFVITASGYTPRE